MGILKIVLGNAEPTEFCSFPNLEEREGNLYMCVWVGRI